MIESLKTMERQSAELFSNCPFESGHQVVKQATEIVKKQVESNPGIKKESTEPIQTQLDNLINGFGYFGVQFKYAQDIYSQTTLTIHQEKAKCKKAYRDNTFLQKATNGFLNIIMGDNPHIKSNDVILEGYAKRWSHFSNYGKEMKNGVKQALITGDGFVRKIKGDKGSFKYKNIENSEDMYIDEDYQEGRVKRYIQRVYATEARAKDIKAPEYVTMTINTPLGTETINGIEYSADEIIHVKLLENIWGLYGRSPIASALEAVDILDQMERSSAVIARYKAIPKKLLFPKTTAEGEIMSDKELGPIKKVLEKMKDFETPMVGTQFDSLNLTDGGQALDLTPYFDYFKRKISIVMSPEFVIHGELVNRSTSDDQAKFFFLDVCAVRQEFEGAIEESSHEGLIASLKVLEDKDIETPKAHFEFVWGEYDVELREEKTNRIQKEWNDGMIKLNEYREQMNYPLEEQEFGEFYSFEVKSSPEAAVGESLKKLVGDKND